jgi:tetratricopeptide (TPR) repeat protein
VADVLSGDLVARALAAVERTDDDPRRARADALALLDDPDIRRSPEATSIAHRAVARAALELDDLSEASRHARWASRVATGANLAARAAEAQLTLAGTEATRGRWKAALQALDSAEELADHTVMARVLSTRATMLWVLDRLDEALAASDLALAALADSEMGARATALNTRAGILIQLGRFTEARDALERAEVLFTADRKAVSAAEMHHYRGIATAHLGDLPTALTLFDEAEELLVKAGKPLASYDLFRVDHLRSARLLDEARVLAERSVDALDAAGMRPLEAEARLRLTEVLLDAGRSEEARTAARAAAVMFSRQGRPMHAAICRYLEARAVVDSGQADASTVRRAIESAAELDAQGQPAQAEAAHLVAGRLLLAAGRADEAAPHLERAAASRSSGPALGRLRGWHAEALRHHQRGDGIGAQRAAAAGLRVLGRHRAAMGATELRALAAGHGRELAELGLGIALERARPAEVLTWTERFRAGSLSMPPVRPPDEEQLAATLAALRSAVTESRTAVLDGDDPAPSARRQAKLEAEVQRLTRRTGGAGSEEDDGTVGLADVRERLDGRVLIELLEHRGRLAAVVVGDGRARLVRLGQAADANACLDGLALALRRLAAPVNRRPAVAAALRQAVADSLAELDDTLIAPLRAPRARSTGGDAPVVVVPTAALHRLPWAALPSMAGRVVTIAPSARVWLQASDTRLARARGDGRPDDGRVVLAAGPGLEHADREVAALAGIWPSASVLVGDEAGTRAVSEALDGATLAHIAAHGDFRRDNALFSSLRLTDGPLYVYDIEGLAAAPGTIVLSACDSGVQAPALGDELVGLAATLLARGTTDLVASVVPVPDDATTQFMTALHRGLASGRSAAEARLLAAEAMDPTDGSGLVTAVAFSSFGAG